MLFQNKKPKVFKYLDRGGTGKNEFCNEFNDRVPKNLESLKVRESQGKSENSKICRRPE